MIMLQCVIPPPPPHPPVPISLHSEWEFIAVGFPPNSPSILAF